MRYRVIGNVTTIQSDCLAVEKIGESLVGSRGITQRTGRDRKPPQEIFIELAFKTKTHTYARAIAVKAGATARIALEEVLASDPDVPDQPEAAHKTFQCRHPVLPCLRRCRCADQATFHTRQIS
ncbi:MAG: hypothetical protein DMG68_04970 [Acidobacteria bacterium]|nr:MAG: hypothetical protein DMG68_04970 [Acidobacteriota bacterium]